MHTPPIRPALHDSLFTAARSLALAIPTAWALSGCAANLATPAAPPSTAVAPPSLSLPLRLAWVDGRQVSYVTTDVSDAGMARDMGVNHVPRLADALLAAGSPQRSLLERVYMFGGGEQLNVFQSAPRPAGPTNADRSYSPLWQIVLVVWVPGIKPELLSSEEAILAAQERGQITLTRTSIVANCPVLRSADGQGFALPR